MISKIIFLLKKKALLYHTTIPIVKLYGRVKCFFFFFFMFFDEKFKTKKQKGEKGRKNMKVTFHSSLKRVLLIFVMGDPKQKGILG